MTTANRIEKRRLPRKRGLETIADWVAIAFLVVGVIVAVIFLYMYFKEDAIHWGLLAVVATLFSAFVYWLLFRCLAEHLRLQKKIAGLRFDGAITGQEEEIIWACSHCGHVLYADHRCDYCGSKIQLDQPS